MARARGSRRYARRRRRKRRAKGAIRPDGRRGYGLRLAGSYVAGASACSPPDPGTKPGETVESRLREPMRRRLTVRCAYSLARAPARSLNAKSLTPVMLDPWRAREYPILSSSPRGEVLFSRCSIRQADINGVTRVRNLRSRPNVNFTSAAPVRSPLRFALGIILSRTIKTPTARARARALFLR